MVMLSMQVALENLRSDLRLPVFTLFPSVKIDPNLTQDKPGWDKPIGIGKFVINLK